MLIEDIYDRRPWTISPNSTIGEAVNQMVKDKCNGMVVVDADKVVGVIALQDIAGATVPEEFRQNVSLAAAMFSKGMFSEICQELSMKKVSDIMRTDFLKVDLKTNILAVMADFLNNDLYIVPVVEDNKLIGIVTRKDIKKAIYIKMKVDKL